MTNNNTHTIARRGSAPAKTAWVKDPSVRKGRHNAPWRVKLLKLEQSGTHQIEIGFFTRADETRTLLIDNSRRAEFDFIRRELDSRSARLPDDKRAANAFVADLVRAVPESPIIACASPGFRDGATGFIMPFKRYGTAKGKFVWDEQNAPNRAFGKLKGDLPTYQRETLKIAAASPYVAGGIDFARRPPPRLRRRRTRCPTPYGNRDRSFRGRFELW